MGLGFFRGQSLVQADDERALLAAVDQGPMSSEPSEFYVVVKDFVRGPYAPAALIKAGLKRSDKVLCVGTTEWLAAEQVPELLQLIEAAARAQTAAREQAVRNLPPPPTAAWSQPVAPAVVRTMPPSAPPGMPPTMPSASPPSAMPYGTLPPGAIPPSGMPMPPTAMPLNSPGAMGSPPTMQPMSQVRSMTAAIPPQPPVMPSYDMPPTAAPLSGDPYAASSQVAAPYTGSFYSDSMPPSMPEAMPFQSPFVRRPKLPEPAERYAESSFLSLRTWFYTSCILMNVMVMIGSAMTYQALASRDESQATVGGFCTLLGSMIGLLETLLSLIILHRSWNLIQDGEASTTPGKAVGFLFVPLFNLYWMFVACAGLATNFNKFAERHRLPVPPAPETLGMVACISTLVFFFPFVGACTMTILLGRLAESAGRISTALTQPSAARVTA